MSKIKIIQASSNIIPDSRGQDTIEVILSTGNFQAKAAVPAGKSRGTYESVPVSPQQAQENINQIFTQIKEKDFFSVTEFDQFLLEKDGTSNKSNLGANTTLALSIAFTRLLAQTDNIPLYQLLGQLIGAKPTFPKLFINLINGGLHAPAYLNPLPCQEYLIIPQHSLPSQSLDSAFIFIESLKKGVSSLGQTVVLGDEGGFVVAGDNIELGLELLQKASISANLSGKIRFGLDMAASSFSTLSSKSEVYYKLKDICVTKEELDINYSILAGKYNLLSIEDPFGENDWEDWRDLTQKLGKEVWIVGDDLTVTNEERIRKTKDLDAANAIIIKPNQIGTISETLKAIKLARSYGWKIIVSHRSGETEDSFIADLAYGVGADGLKAGSPSQKERVAKYNRLIEIEKSL